MFLRVTGKLTAMSYTTEQLRTIGDAVRRERIVQGLDKEPAAREADLNSITWKRVEDGKPVREGSLGKVLSLLGLPSADEILEAEAVRRSESPVDPTPPPEAIQRAAEHAAMVDMRIAVNARWNVALDLVDIVLGLPTPPRELRAVAYEAMWMIGDLLTAEVLRSNQAENAKEILDRLYETRFQARQRLVPKEKSNALSADQTPKSDASAEAGKVEEVSDGVKGTPLVFGTGKRAAAREDGAEEGQ